MVYNRIKYEQNLDWTVVTLLMNKRRVHFPNNVFQLRDFPPHLLKPSEVLRFHMTKDDLLSRSCDLKSSLVYSEPIALSYS